MNKKEIELREKQELVEMLQEAEKRKCELSFYEFYKAAFAVLEPGIEFIDGPHIEYLCFIFQREFERILKGKKAPYRDIVINVPPRTSKSNIFSIVAPVWCWVRKPEFRLFTATYSSDLSKNFSFKSIQIIKSEWFQSYWGEKFSVGKTDGGKESVGHTVNNKRGERKTASTTSNLTGFGGMIGIIDDPVNPEQASSPAAIAAVTNWYRETLPSRLNNQNVGVFFTIMQRLSENDPSQLLIDKGKRTLHICLPAMAKPGATIKIPSRTSLPYLKFYEDGTLFPGLLGREVLEGMEEDFSALTFATQYQQQPAPLSGIHLKKEHMVVISREEFDREYRNRQKTKHFFGDTSFGEKTAKGKDPDPSGVLSCCQIGKDLFILGGHTQVVPSEDLPPWYERWCITHGYLKGKSVLKLEPKSSGPTVIGLMKKNKKITTVPYRFPKSGAVSAISSKEERFKAIVPYVASGLPKGGNVFFVMWDSYSEFEDQVTTFPNARNDEYADLLTMAVLDWAHGKLGSGAYSTGKVKISS